MPDECQQLSGRDALTSNSAPQKQNKKKPAYSRKARDRSTKNQHNNSQTQNAQPSSSNIQSPSNDPSQSKEPRSSCLPQSSHGSGSLVHHITIHNKSPEKTDNILILPIVVGHPQRQNMHAESEQQQPAGSRSSTQSWPIDQPKLQIFLQIQQAAGTKASCSKSTQTEPVDLQNLRIFVQIQQPAGSGASCSNSAQTEPTNQNRLKRNDDVLKGKRYL